MKRSLLLAFLLVLYIGPSLFALSYASPTTPTETNMIKDFAVAESVNDVIFADAGSANGTTGYGVIGDYIRTNDSDGFSYTCFDASGPSSSMIYLNFTLPYTGNQIENVTIATYADISTGTGSFSIWNYTSGSWDSLATNFGAYGAYSWVYDDTLFDSDYWPDGIVWLRYETTHTTNTQVRVDYAEIEYYATPPEWRTVGTAELVFDVEGWNIINEVDLVFIVPIDETGLNMLLVFLGLGMIPVSVIYLVWGGKNEMSMDKVFYGIVVFIFGWALFLGGIYA